MVVETEKLQISSILGPAHERPVSWREDSCSRRERALVERLLGPLGATFEVQIQQPLETSLCIGWRGLEQLGGGKRAVESEVHAGTAGVQSGRTAGGVVRPGHALKIDLVGPSESAADKDGRLLQHTRQEWCIYDGSSRNPRYAHTPETKREQKNLLNCGNNVDVFAPPPTPVFLLNCRAWTCRIFHMSLLTNLLQNWSRFTVKITQFTRHKTSLTPAKSDRGELVLVGELFSNRSTDGSPFQPLKKLTRPSFLRYKSTFRIRPSIINPSRPLSYALYTSSGVDITTIA